MNILFITSCFPSFDVKFKDPRTKFVYYYASEWVKQGHNVLILHSVPRYPRLFSMTVAFIEHYLKLDKLQLKRFWQNPDAVKALKYEYEGINIIRTPINKYIPHSDYSSFELKRHSKRVNEKYIESGFNPEVIFLDFLTPAIYIAEQINQTRQIPSYQILHQTDFEYFNKHPELLQKVKQMSGVLLRSYTHSERLNDFRINVDIDYMFTGVPNNTFFGSPRSNIKKLLFAGSLRETKNIHIVIKALAASENKHKFTFDIIGDGPYLKNLQSLVKKLDLEKQVTFLGKLPREEVLNKMKLADCFVMVSKETFGMVYIEALSQGCVVVASKNEGVDGIITEGENGFLVESGNISELTELLDNMSELNSDKIESISRNGLATASKMTDGKLAESLLQKLNIE